MRIQCQTSPIMKWPSVLGVMKLYTRLVLEAAVGGQRQQKRIKSETPHLEPGNTGRSQKGAGVPS